MTYVTPRAPSSKSLVAGTVLGMAELGVSPIQAVREVGRMGAEGPAATATPDWAGAAHRDGFPLARVRNVSRAQVFPIGLADLKSAPYGRVLRADLDDVEPAPHLRTVGSERACVYA
jgi:hypothetical protein